jgi:hypothetical protein
MWSDIKHLSTGLVIGILSAIALIVGILFAARLDVSAEIGSTETRLPATATLPSSTATVTPSATITPSPTITPTFTPSLSPSATPTLGFVEQLILSGTVFITGPLPREQQINLYLVSLNYVAPTTEESLRLGEQINGDGYGSPSVICGPLALAIMKDADLVEDPELVPYDFWLLNPASSKDRLFLRRAFPPAQYNHEIVPTPLNEINWMEHPLQPGDFLYINHGSWGNFDHMLVVNRVDSQLRAFAVTNYATPEGYIITEVMLYDPNDRSAGMFHTWTQRRDSPLGSTGFGGFEAWRLRSSQ